MRINQPYGVRYEYEEFSEEPKKRYFIACEGKKTEYKYFKGIMDNRVEIKINPLIEIIPINHDPNTGSNPLHIYHFCLRYHHSALYQPLLVHSSFVPSYQQGMFRRLHLYCPYSVLDSKCQK